MDNSIKIELVEVINMFSGEQVEIPLSDEFKFRLRNALDLWCDKFGISKFAYTATFSNSVVLIEPLDATVKYALFGIMSLYI